MPYRYRSFGEDSGRWDGFTFRPGDIVISTRSKHGTTWLQMICALLTFRTPDLPAPLAELSPWLDHLIEPRQEVVACLERQWHRRFIKTHTPLDGVPFDSRVTYLVGARHPLDAAISLYHHSLNIDRERMGTLIARDQPPRRLRPLTEWLAAWIANDPPPQEALDSLPGVLHHLDDAWIRRTAPNVALVHYADLTRDLPGEMTRIADFLGLDPPTPELIAAASFDHMRARADLLAPNRQGVLKDPQAFFRHGRSGAAAAILDMEQLTHYHERVTGLAAPDLLAWLHR